MDISTKRGQDAIERSTEIHWAKVSKGLSVGLYKFDSVRWYARVFYKGKYTRQNLPEAFDYKSAVAEANTFEAAVKQGTNETRAQKAVKNRGNVITVRELFDEYQQSSDKAQTAHERGNYHEWQMGELRRYKQHWGHLDSTHVSAVTKDMLKAHRDHLKITKGPKGNLLSPDTINRNMVGLNAALEYGVSKGYLTTRPHLKALPKQRQGKRTRTPEYFDKASRAAILENCGTELRGILTACEFTGCRPIEARRLKVSDVNLSGGAYVYLYHYKGDEGGGGRERKFPLAGPRLQFFKRMVKGRKPDETIFLTPKERKPWERDNLSKALRDVTRPMDLEATFTAYCFRHAFITEALEQDARVTQLAKLCGTSVKHIEDNYAHLLPSAIDNLPAL